MISNKEREILMPSSSSTEANNLTNDKAENKSSRKYLFDGPYQKYRINTSQAEQNGTENKNPTEEFSNNGVANTGSMNSPFKVPFFPQKVAMSPITMKWDSLTSKDLNSSFDIGRESLGILPNNIVSTDPFDVDNLSMRESLGILHITPRESLGFFNVSARDSLGILNTSVLNDFGRESIDIFDIKSSFRRRPSLDGRRENGIENLPEITVDEPIVSKSAGSLNTGFLLTHSRQLSVDPSFNVQSFEEPSKIGSLMSDFGASNLATTDLFNEAFEGSNEFSNNHLTTSFGTPVSKGLFSSNLGCVRKRIHSLPVTFEEKSGVEIIKNKILQEAYEMENSDSVFTEDNKVADDIADVNINNLNDVSGTIEKNFLDATPQPDWPDELNESKLTESVSEEKVDKEIISKKVDKMFGILPNVEIKIRSRRNSGSTSSENSTNISRISKTSRGNNSQNISRITRNSEDSISRLISDLSQLIQNKEDLSDSIKQEGRNKLHYIQNILDGTSTSSKSRASNNEEDSGHSSVDEQQLEDQSHQEKNSPLVNEVDSPSVIRRKEQVQNGPISKLTQRHISSPTSSKIAIIKTTNSSMPSNVSQGSNEGKKNYTSVVGKYSLTAGSQRKTNIFSLDSKSGPLKAIIPIESMAKNIQITSSPPNAQVMSCTPPKRQSKVSWSKKTSTPIQESKLKPMAASTPTTFEHLAGEEKTSTVLPLSRSKYSTRPSSLKDSSVDLVNPKISNNAPKTMAKYYTSLIRRNSAVAENKSVKHTTVARRSSVSEGQSVKKNYICERQNSENISAKLSKIIRRNSISEGHNTEDKSKKSNTIIRRNSVSEGQNGKAVVNKTLARLEKGLVGRNSVVEGSKKPEPSLSPRTKRSFSTGAKDTKIMSALLKVRQNILSSPYYSTKSQSSTRNSHGVLSDNNRVGDSKSVHVKNYVESPLKKLGKENIKK